MSGRAAPHRQLHPIARPVDPARAAAAEVRAAAAEVRAAEPDAAAAAAAPGAVGDDVENCPNCHYPNRDPVYPMLGDGRACDRDSNDEDAANGHHVCCRACLVRWCLTDKKCCPVCKHDITQMMTKDGPVPLPSPLRAVDDRRVMLASGDEDVWECELCIETGCTPNDRMFVCSRNGCTAAWHQRCAKIPAKKAEHLEDGNEDTHVVRHGAWCSKHAPVRHSSPPPPPRDPSHAP